MFCQNCGKKLPDGARFCSGCGTPVPAQEEAEILETPVEPAPEAPAAEPSAEAPAQSVPEAVPEPAPLTEEPSEIVPATPAAAVPVQLEPLTAATAVAPLPETGGTAGGEPILGQKKGRGKALILLGVVAAAVIALAFVAVKLVSGGDGGGKPAYVYLTGDDELMFLKDLKADAEKSEITDEKSNDVQFSPDGKYVYFAESKSGYSDLYRMEIARIGKEGAEPQKISSEVSYYEFLPEGKLVFLKGREEKQLRFFDGEEDYKLASGVSTFTVNEAATHAYYTELDDGAYTLYRVPLAEDGEKEKLVKDASEFLTDLDAEPLVYCQSGGDGTQSVYSIVPGGEKEKLASNAAGVVDLSIDGSQVHLLYAVTDKEASIDYGATYAIYSVASGGEKEKLASDVAEVHGWDLSGGKAYLVYSVIDQSAEDGAYMTYTLYSVESGGEKQKLANDVSDVFVISAEGGKINLLYTTMEVETHTLYEFVTDSLAADDASAREPNYEDFQTIDPYWGWYSTDWDAYYAARDSWWNVSSRNGMRESLKEMERNFTSYAVTLYENGEETLLFEDADSMAVFSPEDEIYIYTKQEGTVETVADLADLEYSYEIYDLLKTPEQTWYVNVNGAESELDLEEGYTPEAVYTLNGSKIVLSAYDAEYEDALFHYTLADDKLTDGGTLTDEPFAGLTYGTSPDGKEGLYYFTDLDEKNSTGELICYTGGEKTTIAKEARYVFVLDGKTVFKLDEVQYNSRREATEGSFYTVQDGKSAKLADDVDLSSITILDAKQILYIGDGDLCFWNGAESTKLASDVTAFWHNQETAAYDFYSCETSSDGSAEGWDEWEDWEYDADWDTWA